MIGDPIPTRRRADPGPGYYMNEIHVFFSSAVASMQLNLNLLRHRIRYIIKHLPPSEVAAQSTLTSRLYPSHGSKAY